MVGGPDDYQRTAEVQVTLPGLYPHGHCASLPCTAIEGWRYPSGVAALALPIRVRVRWTLSFGIWMRMRVIFDWPHWLYGAH